MSINKSTIVDDEDEVVEIRTVKLTEEEVARWRKNGAFLDKPETAEEQARWEDEGGPVEALPAALEKHETYVEGLFTREEIKDAVEAPIQSVIDRLTSKADTGA